MRTKSKYHSRKITRDGITFDSVKEYRRYVKLSLLEKAGAITELKRQVEFELLPAQYVEEWTGEYYKRGERKGTPKIKRVCIEKSVKYIADFVYTDEKGQLHVEDVKGYKTPEYIIKRKLMWAVHSIRIEEV